PYSKVAVLIAPGPTALAEPTARWRATLRALRCVTALRQWSLTHRTPPADLAAALKAAGMPSVPLDPYDGNPLRLAVVAGKRVVYSVGRDGTDDGGRVDSENGRKPGDLLF